MYPYPENLTSVTGFFQYIATDATGGFFGWALLVMMFFIILMSTFNKIDTKSVLATLTMVTVLAVFLALFGIVNGTQTAVLFILTGVTFFVYLLTK